MSEDTNQPSPLSSFDTDCFHHRDILRALAPQLRALMEHPAFSADRPTSRDFGEMKANIMLAYRHIEDATMRLGKAIQAYDGGKSVYPR